MTKNPILNALIAVGYIGGVVFFITQLGNAIPEDNILMPMLALSLLTFSVAFMGFTFFFEPMKLMLSGEREAAAGLFLKTLGAFGCAVILIMAAVLYVGGVSIG